MNLIPYLPQKLEMIHRHKNKSYYYKTCLWAWQKLLDMTQKAKRKNIISLISSKLKTFVYHEILLSK